LPSSQPSREKNRLKNDIQTNTVFTIEKQQHHVVLSIAERQIILSTEATIRYSPDMTSIVTVDPGRIILWGIPEGEARWVSSYQPDRSLEANWSPDGKYIAVGNTNKVEVLDSVSGNRHLSLDVKM